MNQNQRHILTALVLALILVALAGSVFEYAGQNRILTEESIYRTLNESSAQQLTLFKTKLADQFAQLETLATHVGLHGGAMTDDVLAAMDAMLEVSGYERIGLIREGGREVVMSDGSSYDASDRQYWRRALKGESNIEYLPESNYGEKAFALAVPVRIKGRIAATLVATYDMDRFAELLTVHALEGNGYSFITDNTGAMIVAAHHAQSLIESSNAVRFFERASLAEDVTPAMIAADLGSGRSRTIAYEYGNEKRYASYAPVGVNDWYIFSVATDEVMRAQTATSAKLVYILSAKLLVIFAGLLTYILIRERQIRRAILISEEEYRVAAGHSEKVIIRYDIQAKTAHYAASNAGKNTLGGVPTKNVPDSMVQEGDVCQESAADFLALFDAMRNGEPTGSTLCRMQADDGSRPWYRIDYTLISDRGAPRYAIISAYDVTRERENELAYEKWRNSIAALPQEEIKLFECNLTKDVTEHEEGAYMDWLTEDTPAGFNDRTAMAASAFVHPEDREGYVDFLDRDRLLAQYYQGRTEVSDQFRMIDKMDTFHWVDISVQMVPYRDSSDIKAFVLFRDIDEKKRNELILKEMSETDALTKALNRTAFRERVERLFSTSGPEAQHAFLFLDIDRFKQINDTIGHAAGDHMLTMISSGIRSILRHEDIIGRFGGDEFAVCLKNVPFRAVTEQRARQICELARKKLSSEITGSISLGIALYPADGKTFDELYEKADTALYHVKNAGGDSFTFYSSVFSNASQGVTPMDSSGRMPAEKSADKPRVMLIVDDAEITRTLLAKMFENDFRILTAADGAEALRVMRRYGAGLSVVLLDIYMPGVDGMGVLNKMRMEPELGVIPVVVVSDGKDPESALEAIELGAADFVPKPVDPRIIRVRVMSAIARAESDRLRAQNAYLSIQSAEKARYRQILTSTGTAIVEYDLISQEYTYDALLPRILAGNYDSRPLWEVLTNDGIAEADAVEAMRMAAERAVTAHGHNGETVDVYLHAASGEKRWFRMAAHRLTVGNSSDNKLLITFNDVNREHMKAEQLLRTVETDALTGTLNRAAFMNRAAAMLEEGKPEQYVMIHTDIDRFKVINEMFGHADGDRLLVFVGRILRELVNGDGICCRLSADYFAACMRMSETLIERVVSTVNEALAGYGLPFEITMSFGFYIIDDVTATVDAMLDRAALAQKTVKNNYMKHHAVYDNSLLVTMLNEQEVVNSADAALDEHQFEIYLQPQYDHADKRVIGAEALVRWIHPHKGVIPPARFVPIFERNGFISKLDYYVWEEACRILRRWADAGRTPLPISVNLSRLDIYNPHLAGTLSELTERYNVPHGLLKLEITEGAYMENAKQLIDVVKELQRRGFMIEMDDFGSGYSAINTLKDVPVDVLKMDMNFLKGDNKDKRTDSILASIITMAHGLGIPVIAEGVETETQADHLLELGCRIVQGFYYASPMPVSKFDAMMDGERK